MLNICEAFISLKTSVKDTKEAKSKVILLSLPEVGEQRLEPFIRMHRW